MMRTQNVLAGLMRRFLLAAHPVGSLYWSADAKSPQELFGGSWVRITDTFIMAAGSKYTAGTSGGQSAINLQHTHTTGNHTLTIGEVPEHDHGQTMIDEGAKDQWGCQLSNATGYTAVQKVYKRGSNQPHNHGNTGNALSSTQSIIPPYQSYYCWRRTA